MTQELNHYFLCSGAEYGWSNYDAVIETAMDIRELNELVKQKYGQTYFIGGKVNSQELAVIRPSEIIFVNYKK